MSKFSLETSKLAILKDEMRLAICIYLMVYNKLTLKQLSKFLSKGKTTVHHHIKKLEKKGIIDWEEEEGDKKQLKTRYYFINQAVLERMKSIPRESKSGEVPASFKSMKTGALPFNEIVNWTVNWISWMIKISEELETSEIVAANKQRESHIRTFTLTDETLPVYEEYMARMLEAINEKDNAKKGADESSLSTHIVTNMFFPIKDLLELKRKE
ncbi:MAG: winged helix-turn-helix domain-containing protein [Candidatus Odinarchaeota archaeon]